LTGLANRKLFSEQAEAALGAADGDTRTAVVLIDLDGFKAVNDTYGHAAGDELLIAAGVRMRSQLRDDDLVARLEGDEFAILLPRITAEEYVDTVAARVLQGLAAPLVVAGASLGIRASVGIAVGHGDRAELPDLLRQADIALYRAKAEGKGRAFRHKPNLTAGLAVT
jgi:diguanylate cyclase (GGDEF)-like protein